ncbi:MAG: hypothetical protein CGU28_02600 [Candidatus Dactylopiibacterium carminicum]|nr:MAG: hypothetical protein CGU28_02600 [Candidatus Dactylopiibacterium carminicum]
METPMLRKTLVAAMMLAFWGSAGAAGLGRISVMSSLGQPLRAEVELTANVDELETMTARMASPDAFKRANMEYVALLGGIKMSIERRSARPVILLTSDRSINEPFVGLLLDLNWAGGRLLREYTFLLDPAELSGPRGVPSAVEPISTPLESRSASRPAPAPGRAAQAPLAVAKPVAEPRPTSSEAASSDAYTVQRGDTLYRIADRLKSGEVSQEQMMAALYRANADAFAGGDANRIHAGRILKVPQQTEAQQISRAEARKIVFRATNFEQYRQGVAASVANAPARDAGTQAASGRIAPRVEGDAPASTQPRDQVRVTSSEAPRAAAAEGAATKARLDALTDELAARDRALKEANERRVQLENNVKELQKLLELQNESLAKMQASAAETGKAAEPPKAHAEQASAPVAAEASPAGTAVEQAPVIESVEQASAPVEEPKPAPVAKEPRPAARPVPPPPPEDDGLLRNLWALLGLAVAGALTCYVVIKQRRRRAAAGTGNTLLTEVSTTTSPNSVFGSAGGQVVDTGGTSLLHTDFSQSGISAIDADEEVDPVAEADVYMAYGRDAQAEEILLDAIKNDPSRAAVYVKLLEIYAQRRSLKQFENVATDLYAQTNGQGDDWAKAAALGARLDPQNPLYKSGQGEAAAQAPVIPDVPEELSEPATPAVSFGTDNVSQVCATWTVPGDISQFNDGAPAADERNSAAVVPEALNLDFNLDLDTPSSEDLPTQMESRDPPSVPKPVVDLAEDPESQVTTQGAGAPLEFDIGFDEPELQPAPVHKPAPQPAPAPVVEQAAPAEFDLGLESASDRAPLAEVDLEKTNFDGSLLDFDFELGEETNIKPTIDLSGVNLGEAEPIEVPRAPVEPIQDDIDLNDEVSTKLELARAYEEMGDVEGARELLEEVIADGGENQRQQAQGILARLGA